MDTVLKNLLSQYSQKKTKAEIDARKRKQDLYVQYPSLQKIDDNLSSLAISTTRNLINHNDKKLLDDLNSKIEKLKHEKEHVLNSIGISNEYLEPHYECNLCKDTGYITNSDYTVSMCSCLKQKLYNEQYNQENISNLDTQNFENFTDRYNSDKVDPSHNSSWTLATTYRKGKLTTGAISLTDTSIRDNYEFKNYDDDNYTY